MLALGIPAAASADCVDLGDGGRLAKRSATFVFDGTVLKVEQIAADGTRTPVPDVNATIPTEKDYYPRQFAATFEVHRVWKGDVSRTFTVYFVEDKLARWEGDEMPISVAELNKSAAAITAGEGAWSDPRSWWEQFLDIFKK